MLRTQNLFALAAIGVLGFGLLLSQFGSQSDLVITTPSRSYALSVETPLYCIAALFGAFAFLYSIGYIPFSSTMAKWHFWLSLVSVFLCVAGAAIISWYLSGTADTKIGIGGNLVAVSFLAGLLTFVSMQLWFAVDLLRALFKIRPA